MLALVVSFIDRQIITLLVQPIRADLAISDTGMSLLMGFAFAIFYVTMGVPIARLSDRHSRRTIIAIGIFLWSLATAACGLARNYSQLFLARIGVGVGEATLMPAAYSMIADYFPREMLGRAIGVYAIGAYLGAGLALILGGAAIRLITASGPVDLPIVGTLVPWQLTFMVVSLPGLVIVALMMFTVREPVRRNLAETQDNRIPIRDVVKFMWANRGTFGSIFVGYATGGTAFHGFLFWVPEFIRRSYGWDISGAGYPDAGPCGVHPVPATSPVARCDPVVHTQPDARASDGGFLRDLYLLRHRLRGGFGGGGNGLRLPRRQRLALLAGHRLRHRHVAGGDKPGPGNQAVSEEPGAGGGLERFNLTGLAAIAHDFWNPASAGMAAPSPLGSDTSTRLPAGPSISPS